MKTTLITFFIIFSLCKTEEETPFEIAANIMKFINRNNPHSYSVDYKRNDVNVEIKDISMIITSSYFDISNVTTLPVIIYHNVTISYGFIAMLTVNKDKDISKQMKFTRRGLVAKSNYDFVSLSSLQDESYEIKNLSSPSISIDLDDIGDYLYFKDIFNNDMQELKKLLLTAFVDNLNDIVAIYPKGIPLKIYESLYSYITKAGSFKLDCCRRKGVESGAIIQMSYDTMEKNSQYGYFNNVIIDIKYRDKDREETFLCVMVHFIIISQNSIAFSKFSTTEEVPIAIVTEIIQTSFKSLFNL